MTCNSIEKKTLFFFYALPNSLIFKEKFLFHFQHYKTSLFTLRSKQICLFYSSNCSKYSKESVFENFKEWIERDHAAVRGINKHLISSFLSKLKKTQN